MWILQGLLLNLVIRLLANFSIGWLLFLALLALASFLVLFNPIGKESSLTVRALAQGFLNDLFFVLKKDFNSFFEIFEVNGSLNLPILLPQLIICLRGLAVVECSSDSCWS